MLSEELQFLVLGRNRRSVDNQTRLRLLAGSRNRVDVFFIMNQHAFFLQLTCKVAGGLVIAGNHQSATDEITGNGTHTNATGSDEIDSFYIFNFHCLLI